MLIIKKETNKQKYNIFWYFFIFGLWFAQDKEKGNIDLGNEGSCVGKERKHKHGWERVDKLA